MNKSVLGTVLGVGLLSFIKRQSGSSIRLSFKEFVELKISFKLRVPLVRMDQDHQNEELDQIKEQIIQLENLIDDVEIIHEVYSHHISPFNSWDRFEPYTQLTIEVEMNLPPMSEKESIQKVDKVIEEKVKGFIQIVSDMVPIYDELPISISSNFSVNIYSHTLSLMNGTIEEVFNEILLEEQEPNSLDNFNVMIKRNDDPECGMYYSVNLRKEDNPIKLIVNADTGEIYNSPPSRNRLRKR